MSERAYARKERSALQAVRPRAGLVSPEPGRHLVADGGRDRAAGPVENSFGQSSAGPSAGLTGEMGFDEGVGVRAPRGHGRGVGGYSLEGWRRLGEQFQADFAHVRVHTDAAAERSASAVGASAYSTGNDIFFGRDQYAPHTARGARLLAHELVHVMQQSKSSTRLPGPDHEREADELAERALRGEQVAATMASQAGVPQFAGPEGTGGADLPTKGFSPDPGEAAAIGSAGERHQFAEAKAALEREGYTEIYFKDDFPGWVKKAFPSKSSSPEVVAVDPKGNRVLVEDFTAGPWSTAAMRSGDPRRLPQDVPERPGQKPPEQEIAHLEKTIEYGRQAARNLPPELKDAEVAVRDRYWKQGGVSRRISVKSRGRISPAPGAPGRGAEDIVPKRSSTAPAAPPPKQPAQAAERPLPGQLAPPKEPGGGQPAAGKPAQSEPTAATPTAEAPAKRAAPAMPTAEAPAKRAAPARLAAETPARRAAPAKPAAETRARPSASKPAVSKPAASRPAGTAPSVEVPGPRTGGGRGGSKTTALTEHVGTAAAGAMLGQAMNQLKSLAEKTGDKDFVTAIDTLNRGMDAKSFVENPTGFVAGKIKEKLIQGVFDHFSASLHAARQSFENRFPDVGTLQKDPVDTGVSLEDYKNNYNKALAALRVPGARKGLLYAFALAGLPENTPKEEIERRIGLVNQYLATLPGLDVYIQKYNEAADRYNFAIGAVTNQLLIRSDEWAKQPAGLADDLRRRGEALDKAAEALYDVSKRLLESGAVVFDPVAILWMDLETLAQGFEGLASQFREFADEAGRRKGEYDRELTRLQAEGKRIASQAVRPFLPSQE
ncbi:MAG TPA: DUF4157 domain-containing protein [Gemmataceae bacterium]|nr:DUF4157 domain-containing protein [Gemmataceae bacterium]